VDLAQQRARRKVPKSVYAFIEGGTEGEYTVNANREAFLQVTFRPRSAVIHPHRDLATTVMGAELSMPVILAPAGLIRLAHQGGEILAARAAGEIGTAVGVSTMSGYPIEQIAAATSGPVWYQIYFAGGRQGAEVAIERAKRAGCHALIVTVDSAVQSGRERLMAGRGLPRGFNLRTALEWAPETIVRPSWLRGFLRDGPTLEVPNVRLSIDGPSLSIAEAGASMMTSAPEWSDLTWIREQWGGPVAVKGIVTAEDARRAVGAGADAVVVSNHGGNALDGTPATLRVLPEVVEAVGAETEVLMDGGVRRAGDVVKALALGARAVLIGRAYIWPLAAGGYEGLWDVLSALRDQLDRTLALLGCPSVHALDSSYVDVPSTWNYKRL
jgi:isopentenyl diphosphate isomerase/L-lactate dehydrogenase-like FMN-dependent dehydrogenase